MSQTKNLVGVERNVKDNVAVWSKYTIRWNECVRNGSKLIQEICNCLLNLPDNSTIDTDELVTLFQDVDNGYENMVELINKMGNLSLQLEKLGHLQLPNSEECGFPTWDIARFHSTSEHLLSLYKEELLVKKRVKESLANNSDRRSLTTLAAIWTFPKAEPTKKYLLELMLRESGHH